MSETKFIKFNNGTIVNISEIQRIQKANWGTLLIIRSTGGDTYSVSFVSKEAQEKATELRDSRRICAGLSGLCMGGDLELEDL